MKKTVYHINEIAFFVLLLGQKQLILCLASPARVNQNCAHFLFISFNLRICLLFQIFLGPKARRGSDFIFILVLHVLAKKLASQVFQTKNFQILSKEGHDFPYKFQQILEKVENDREKLPFISDENNYSNRSYGLFRSKSSLIMTSAQDFSQNLFLGSFPEGGHISPPPRPKQGVQKARPKQG